MNYFSGYKRIPEGWRQTEAKMISIKTKEEDSCWRKCSKTAESREKEEQRNEEKAAK